jgi:Acetyltransferases
MQILNSTAADIPTLYELYDHAIAYQKEKSLRHWGEFDQSLIEKEIEEKRQWKIVEDGTIACFFMIAYEDPYIWGERNADPSIYIHRIVTNPAFRGRHYIHTIVEWAKDHAAALGKKFIRMDTWGDNEKLNAYYINCGFTPFGIVTQLATENLPKHYSGISLSLLEIQL